MNIWDIKATLYLLFRRLWPLRWIIDQENSNLVGLISSLELRDKLVLEIGCGIGNVLDLIPEGVKAFGIDSSFKMIKKTQENCDAPIVLGDATYLPFRNGVADLALCVGLLEYLHDWIPFIKKLRALIKNNGYLLITSSPPGIFAFFRNLQGIYLKTTTPKEFIEEVQGQGLILIAQNHSLMQNQYLFKKED